MTGGHRAPLAAAWLSGDIGAIVGVGLNASGQVVKGAGATGVIGVVCLQKAHPAGTIVDVMQDGEMVECTGLAAGTRYYAAAAAGALGTTNTDKPVGWTVEATRLIVRLGR